MCAWKTWHDIHGLLKVSDDYKSAIFNAQNHVLTVAQRSGVDPNKLAVINLDTIVQI